MKHCQQVINNLIEKEIKFYKTLEKKQNEHYYSRIRNIHREAFKKC